MLAFLIFSDIILYDINSDFAEWVKKPTLCFY